MQRLCTSANLAEAHLLLHRLMRAGIEARVFNEHAQGGLGEIPFTQAWAEIWIMENTQVARARAILKEFEDSPVTLTAQQCGACGETNPPGFEICWYCGSALPAPDTSSA